MVSLFNKVTVILEGLISVSDWSSRVRKYTKQKRLLTNNERTGGLLDSDDELDDAREQRRQLGEMAERRPVVEVPVAAEAASAEKVSFPSGSSWRMRRTKTKAPKRKRSKTSGSSEEGSSQAEETESLSTILSSVEAATLLPEKVVVLNIAVEVTEEVEKEKAAMEEGSSLPPIQEEGTSSSLTLSPKSISNFLPNLFPSLAMKRSLRLSPLSL